MTARSQPGPGRRAVAVRGSASGPEPSLPPSHPALLLAAILAGLVVVGVVTYRLTTPDVWQHLLVGKVIWTTGRIPFEHLWTWPSYGRPEVLNSWGFRALLWPFWSAGEVWGLQLWRWLTTLAAFALAWATARRLGARGFTPLLLVALGALIVRSRAQVRPETLVSVLIALQVFLLERRRARGGGAIALVVLAAVWANVHLSYYMGVLLLALHLLARPPRPAAGYEPRGPLARLDHLGGPALLVAAVAASFANPFGWRALAQPFEYFLVWRNEPVYRNISELTPLWLNWRSTLVSGLPFLVAGWPVLLAWRAARGRFDPVEALTGGFFTALALFNSRFAGFYAVALLPYVARGLAEGLGTLRLPRAARGPWAQGAMAVAAMAAMVAPSWNDLRFRPGVGFAATFYPDAACDFIAAHGIRGRLFAPYYLAGTVMWRFWPDRDRLPFMDIHQSGTPRDRELYAYAFARPEAWQALMAERDFEVALLDGHQEWVAGDRLVDQLDADPTWALVFRDDVAALYLRRTPAFAAVIDSFGYRVMPGGQEGFARLGAPVVRDSLLRRALRAELERRAAASPLNAQARSHLANLDFLEGDRVGARRELRAALAVEPTMTGLHRRLGYLDLAEGHWRDGIAELERELALGDPPQDEYARMGTAWERLGDRRRAAAAYRRHLRHFPDDRQAREALAKVEGGA